MIFGFSKKYRRVSPDMIQPIGEPLTTNDAKAVYRSYMLQIRFHNEKDVAEHVRGLGEEIREMEQAYREDVKNLKDEISQTRSLLKDARRDLAAADTDDDKVSAQEHIESAESELEVLARDLDEAEAKYAAFKADKRQFVVDYINRELEG